MNSVEILWEGTLSLNHIKWNNKNFSHCEYFQEYELAAKTNWNKHIKIYPYDYDGTLLFLENFHLENNFLHLSISLTKFSMINYLLKQNILLERGYGALGTQYLIFSPNRDYILVGERTHTQSYFPGAINVPGGILEREDLTHNPSEALIRELKEEVSIPLQPQFYLRAILGGWDNVSVTFLISGVIDNHQKFDPEQTYPSDRYEWKGNLRWLSLIGLKKMSSNNFLDGLTYYQSKLKKNNKLNQ
jgi:8-oxo-dGTP pyrophosphatase MutT (NUDIX family)